MLRPISKLSATSTTSRRTTRHLSISSVDAQIFKQKSVAPAQSPSPTTYPSQQKLEKEYTYVHRPRETEDRQQKKPKRNEVGVQLLSRRLHSQLFRNTSFAPATPAFVQIAKEHLKMHQLDPAQGSHLLDTSFRLPPLQGNNLDEHFYRLGSHASEPWLQQAKQFSSTQLPPKPEYWEIRSGWTKYTYVPDGASYCEPVEFPMHDGQSENMLVFDVETLPKYHPYAIIACAASTNAWYSWISPWLLEETEDPNQLVPLGDVALPRIVVGHNVSYDRARVLEEYNVGGTATRFIDTMALHVAVSGISSHQRPDWMKYRKSKETQLEQQEEAIEVMYDLIRQVEEREMDEVDMAKKDELRRARDEMMESVSQLSESTSLLVEEDSEIAVERRWEELTSANSLKDVAKLHCGIILDKETRSDFMTSTPQEIKDNLSDYLDYCCSDVDVTHRVYTVVLPAFLQSCPHPVTFAGVMEMGSSFLTVNQEWEHYLDRAEGVYKQMEEGVKHKLKKIAEGARELVEMPERWQEDPWLSQLDWTPKVAGKSRGIAIETQAMKPEQTEPMSANGQPAWYLELNTRPLGAKAMERILPLLLHISYDGRPVKFNSKEKWHYIDNNGEIARFETATEKKASQILSARHCLMWMKNNLLCSVDQVLTEQISRRNKSPEVESKVLKLAEIALLDGDKQGNPWLSQLDWNMVAQVGDNSRRKRIPKPKPVKPPPIYWPKWYWDATKPKKDTSPGTLDITVRNRIAPLLLRLSWLGWPLFHSRQHGWTFRVPMNDQYNTRSQALSFRDEADGALANMSKNSGHRFYKLPHKDGEEANVGSPLGKTFIKYSQNGTLQSPGEEAKEALDMNAQCSYWISARDRIMNQMVVWQNGLEDLGFSRSQSISADEKWGIIIPQVIGMGTITRRAIEKTWLTASNAKKHRVGSELKAMVRAPEGYAIVGADVDSEELWISSCMGDAQFGLHGATALGWMTLEGTKAAGTDLHSKTASILGITRDAAKVFNYSRIYGAGQKHAVLLLLQSNPSMEPAQAQKLAQNLYASTKGKNTHRSDMFDRKFWYGGSESYVFNKLEEIALSDEPQTPALGCGITQALSKKHLPGTFGSDYMTSRINWVVQSSGVDYLHLLIVSMRYLIEKYDIQARYLISVHDELRYLVKEKDRYRAALALQIANLWTRCLFAYKLGMDDLPQGVAFFSAVDVDHVLRKEVDMPCVTPSQPNPIAPGESLDISKVLERTNGGTLMQDGSPMPAEIPRPDQYQGHLDGYVEPDVLVHRSKNAAFLQAQATQDFTEVKALARQVSGKKSEVFARSRKKLMPWKKGGCDWPKEIERLLNSSAQS